MQQTETAARVLAERKRSGSDRKRVEMVVETLATLRSRGESLAEVAHDARNMVTALGLYCDLLEEPGVLAAPFTHYGAELRLVAAASRRLVEKLVALDAQAGLETFSPAFLAAESGGRSTAALNMRADADFGRNMEGSPERNRRWDLLPAVPVSNLAAEVLANRNLLSALAGPAIGLTMDAEGGARPVRFTGEDLTRVLVNLVKNAAEAMPTGGRIHIRLSERPAAEGTAACVALRIEDNGPGIPEEALEKIFTSGYTTRATSEPENHGWRPGHRGLGLAIVRSIVETAGGRIWAANREQGGARLEIELPVRSAGL